MLFRSRIISLFNRRRGVPYGLRALEPERDLREGPAALLATRERRIVPEGLLAGEDAAALARAGEVALPALRPRSSRPVSATPSGTLKGLRFESLDEAQAYLDR